MNENEGALGKGKGKKWFAFKMMMAKVRLFVTQFGGHYIKHMYIHSISMVLKFGVAVIQKKSRKAL